MQDSSTRRCITVTVDNKRIVGPMSHEETVDFIVSDLLNPCGEIPLTKSELCWLGRREWWFVRLWKWLWRKQ